MISLKALRGLAGSTFKSVLGGGTVPVVLVALFVASNSASYIRGAGHQKDKCSAASFAITVAAQRRQLERLSGQLKAVENMRRKAEQRSIQDAAKIELWRGKADAFKHEVSKRGVACAVGVDDAGRLLEIGN